jgi:hypothetical protein
MGFFALKKNNIRYGVLVDIGSGSVLAAIVAADDTKAYPDIIWSKREYSPLRQSTSLTDSAKSVMTSLINALMSLDGEGRKTLYEETGIRKIEYLQVTIAAPWSYTATKTITYQSKEDFEVTDTLIAELLRTASQKVQEELLENEKVHSLGLSIIARTTMQIVANGYPIRVTGKQKANSVKVVQASAVAQEYLLDAIIDTQDKMFPGTDISQYSFMLPYYFVMNEIGEMPGEYCLVDITYEATEIGVVRDSVLSYCTHTSAGAFTLARAIADILGVPLEEAYGFLTSEDLAALLSQYPDKKQDAVKDVIERYQAELTELFKETGDSLALPRHIYVHGNLFTEPFFNIQVQKAATKATKMAHATFNITTELLTKKYPPELIQKLKMSGEDTALLISAQFFHTAEYHNRFEQL